MVRRTTFQASNTTNNGDLHEYYTDLPRRYTKYKRSQILSSIFLGPQTPTLKRPEADFWDPTKVVFLNGDRFGGAKGGVCR